MPPNDFLNQPMRSRRRNINGKLVRFNCISKSDDRSRQFRFGAERCQKIASDDDAQLNPRVDDLVEDGSRLHVIVSVVRAGAIH